MRKDTPKYIKNISKELRKNQTEAEEKLWQRLRGNRLGGYKFRRQYCLGRYIADFYCSEARLIVEVDGEIHEHVDRMEYDDIREKELLSREIEILRFTNEQVLKDIQRVLNVIYQKLTRADIL